MHYYNTIIKHTHPHAPRAHTPFCAFGRPTPSPHYLRTDFVTSAWVFIICLRDRLDKETIRVIRGGPIQPNGTKKQNICTCHAFIKAVAVRLKFVMRTWCYALFSESFALRRIRTHRRILFFFGHVLIMPHMLYATGFRLLSSRMFEMHFNFAYNMIQIKCSFRDHRSCARENCSRYMIISKGHLYNIITVT